MTASLRYEPIVKIASGGMATVWLGAMRGALGFRQLVAIKRPHPHLLDDPRFRETLLAEARLAARVHHANVVDVRDVEEVGDSVQLVMDYVEGASLGDLIAAAAKKDARMPPGVAVRVVLDACAGLHAAHELADDAGRPLGFVHRDVSPQNVLVGIDGVARVTDFGIAKCEESAGRHPTTQGVLKGKLGYMSPEYVRGRPADRRTDVFAMGVVLWEALAGKRLFRGASDGETIERVQNAPILPPCGVAAIDGVVLRALARDPEERFATSEALRAALEQAARAADLVASHAEVGAYVREAVGEELERRRRAVREAGARESDAETTSAPSVAVTRRDAPVSRPRGRAGAALLAGLGVVAALGAAAALVALRSNSTSEAASPPEDAAPAQAATSPPSPPITPSTSAVASAPPPPASSAPPRVAPRATSAPPKAPATTGTPPRRPPPNPYPP